MSFLTSLFRIIGLRVPKVNCMILGAAKAGTTSLSNYLSIHPSISIGKSKEPHYFDWNYKNDYKWYEAHYTTNKKYNIDATPSYLFNPTIAERIKEYNPSCKFIILVRNPSERAVSHYYHNLRVEKLKETTLLHVKHFLTSAEELPIEKAFQMEEERLEGQFELAQSKSDDRTYNNYALQYFSYKARGRYSEQLERWFELFPRENFLLLDFEELVNTPKLSLQKVFDFLEVSTVFPEQFDAFNQGNYEKSAALNDLLESLKDYYVPYDKKLVELTGQSFVWMKRV